MVGESLEGLVNAGHVPWNIPVILCQNSEKWMPSFLLSGEIESHRGYGIANTVLLIFAASGDEPNSGLFYKVNSLSSFFWNFSLGVEVDPASDLVCSVEAASVGRIGGKGWGWGPPSQWSAVCEARTLSGALLGCPLLGSLGW